MNLCCLCSFACLYSIPPKRKNGVSVFFVIGFSGNSVPSVPSDEITSFLFNLCSLVPIFLKGRSHMLAGGGPISSFRMGRLPRDTSTGCSESTNPISINSTCLRPPHINKSPLPPPHVLVYTRYSSGGGLFNYYRRLVRPYNFSSIDLQHLPRPLSPRQVKDPDGFKPPSCCQWRVRNDGLSVSVPL